MKFTRSDLSMMRWNLLAFATAVLFSLAVLDGSGGYTENAQQRLREAQNALNGARSQLNSAREDKENMAVYADQYGKLLEQGVIGDDRRLDWMEGLEDLRRQGAVTDFRYTIAPQTSYTATPPIDSGNFDIRYSEMKLQFGLLHEGQLLDFFDLLNQRIKGRYQLAGCTLHRGSDGEVNSVNLSAECTGGWITFKNRSQTP